MVRRACRLLLLLSALSGCGCPDEPPPPGAASEDLASARDEMVRSQVADRGIRDGRVLAAMRKVPRHEFVPEGERGKAYRDDTPSIGFEQKMSRPYIVALLAELAGLGKKSRVLEIGTGSGYGAAVLAELAGEVYTIEILDPLAKRARSNLKRLGYGTVRVRSGDGYHGWPEAAPFDAIIVTAAPPHVPEPLKRQLGVAGKLVIPVGEEYQEIRVVTRTAEGFTERDVLPVRIVPMAGEAVRDRR